MSKIYCPYCQSSKIHKHGKTKSIQRYKCINPECNKTFSETHNSPFRYSKKFKLLWKEYYSLMEYGLNIRQCANKLNINIVTSFFWRHRILSHYNTIHNVSVLKGHVELTKLVLEESFKGSRDVPSGKRGIVNIVSAVSDSNDIASIPVSRVNCYYNNVVKFVYPKIHKDAYLVSYQDNRLVALARKHNSTLHKSIINNIDKTPLDPYYSLKIKSWLKRFRGVATKYIEHYLSWHINIFKNIIAPNLECNPKIKSYIKWMDIKSKELLIDEFFVR